MAFQERVHFRIRCTNVFSPKLSRKPPIGHSNNELFKIDENLAVILKDFAIE